MRLESGGARHGDPSAIIIGGPGEGKSYGIKQWAKGALVASLPTRIDGRSQSRMPLSNPQLLGVEGGCRELCDNIDSHNQQIACLHHSVLAVLLAIPLSPCLLCSRSLCLRFVSSLFFSLSLLSEPATSPGIIHSLCLLI